VRGALFGAERCLRSEIQWSYVLKNEFERFWIQEFECWFGFLSVLVFSGCRTEEF
jgi:hypothetical protein